MRPKNHDETKTTRKEERIQPSSFFVVFIPVFRWVEIVSHRRPPQSAEGMKDFSVFCGVLRWLFILVTRRTDQARLFKTGNSRRRPCASCSARMASLILCAFSGLCSCA